MLEYNVLTKTGRVWTRLRGDLMRAVAYPAIIQDGKVQTLAQRELHCEQWWSWLFLSNRRIAQKFQRGLAEHYGLNEGAYFCIRVFRDDCKVARYELNAVVTAGELHIIK